MLAIPFPAIDPVAFAVGPIAVKWYGLAYAAGLLLGWLYIRKLIADGRLWRGGKAPFTPDMADELFIWVALGVVIGGRLGHIILYEPAYYLQRPLEVLQIWRGGMAFHGGMLGTIVAMWLFARHHKVPALSVMDLVAAAVPIGIFFGRVANFINQEMVGRVTSVPWGVIFPDAGREPRHPSQLYEAVLEGLVLFLVLRWLTHGRNALATPGLTGAAFLVGYGAFRILCELFKDYALLASLGPVPFTAGMLYSIPMIIAGIVAMRLVSARKAVAP